MNSPIHATALARSAARQLNTAMADRPAPAMGRKLTIRDVAELPERAAVSHAPRVAAGKQGAVARAMARQSGLTLEQLAETTRHAALSAHSPAAAAAALHQGPEQGLNQTHGWRTRDMPDEAVAQVTTSSRCSIGALASMCDDLNGSLPVDGQLPVDALIVKLVASCLNLHPALNATRLAGGIDNRAAHKLAVAVLVDEQWRTPVLDDASRLGLASIAQWMSTSSSAEHEFATNDDDRHGNHGDNHGGNHDDGTFFIFDMRAQAQHALQSSAITRCGAALIITPLHADAIDGIDHHAAACGRH